MSEVQPSGYVTDGIDVGTAGGTADAKNLAIDNAILALGTSGTSYDFGEVASGSSVCHTRPSRAASGTVPAARGSQLLNGGSSCTSLGNWLAESFSNLYGNSSCNFAGKSNSYIASYYQTLYRNNSSSPECSVLATALNVYASCSSLGGGSAATSCGFTVTSGGLGCESYNVGSCGSSLFGVSNNSNVCVIQLLQCVNNQSSNGSCFAGNNYNRSSAANFFSSLCNY